MFHFYGTHCDPNTIQISTGRTGIFQPVILAVIFKIQLNHHVPIYLLVFGLQPVIQAVFRMRKENSVNTKAYEAIADCYNQTLLVSGKDAPLKSEDAGDVSSKEGTPYRRTSSVNMKKMQKMLQNAAEENVRSIRQYVTELKERVAKLQYQKQLLVC
ncbi:hypothetical protein ACET3Z_011544 [Daucus carota]